MNNILYNVKYEYFFNTVFGYLGLSLKYFIRRAIKVKDP